MSNYNNYNYRNENNNYNYRNDYNNSYGYINSNGGNGNNTFYNNNKNTSFNNQSERRTDKFFDKINSLRVQKESVVPSFDPTKDLNSDTYDYKNTKHVDMEKFIPTKNSFTFIDFLQSNPDHVNTKVEQCKINQSYEIVDISLTSKGRDEEDSYLKNYLFLRNICRGNTLLVKKPDDFDFLKKCPNAINSTIIRKGMRKFLDLDIEFITSSENKFNRIDHITDENKLLCRKIIFTPVFDALKAKKSIKIYKMVKANGENAQISYCDELKTWVICSKNVALLASNLEDLQKYKPDKYLRYQHAHAIGLCWFEILEKIDVETVEELKQYLKTHTFIGEYIGNQYYQHLVRYTHHTIQFYSIVEKESANICIPVDEAMMMFAKFKLKMVSIEEIGVYSSWETLCNALEALYKRIAESSIIDEEEGSVIYLASNEDNSKEEILTLCKLKTLEYRVYRKLREKLTNHLIRNKDDRFKINQYFDEVRNMLSKYSLPMPLDFYYKFAETAFDFIKCVPFDILPQQIEDGDNSLRAMYLDFVETILTMIDKTMSLKTQSISDHQILNRQKLLDFKFSLGKNKIDVDNQNAKDIFNQIEIYAYLPPFIDGLDNLEKEFFNNLGIKVGKEGFAMNNKDNGRKIKFNIIHWHSFKNITKLKPNQFLLFLDSKRLQDEDIFNKLVVAVTDKSSNPQYKTYITDETLRRFFEKTDKSNIEATVKLYINNSIQFENKSVEYLNKNSIYQTNNLNDNEISNIITWIKDKYQIATEEVFTQDNIKLSNDLNKTEPNKKMISVEQNITKEKYTLSNVAKTYPDYKEYIMHYQVHRNPFNSVKEDYLRDLHEKERLLKLQEKKKNYDNKNINDDEKLLVVLVPMTLPGSGKTSFVNSLRDIMNEKKISFFSISSDAIRANLMSTLMARNRRMSRDEAFQQTGKYAGKEFEKALREQIELYIDCKNNKGLLYIDKNHPPNAISRSLDTIRTFVNHINEREGYEVLKTKFVALISDSNQCPLLGKSYLPYSLEYFYQCYDRVYKRRDHETLNGDNADLISIFGTFISNFIDFEFGDNLLLHYKFDNILKLPFTQNTPVIVNDELQRVFSNYVLDMRTKTKEINLKNMINKLVEKNTYNYPDTYNELNTITEVTIVNLLEIEKCRKDLIIEPRPGVSLFYFIILLVRISRIKDQGRYYGNT